MGKRVAGGRIVSTAVSVGAVAALVVAVAALPREPTARMTAQQSVAGIFVVNESTGMLGRATVATGSIEPVLPLGAEHVDLVQASNTAIVIDRQSGEASAVDAAALTRSEAVLLPSDDALVALAMVGDGARQEPVMDAAILSPRDGDLWLVPMSDFDRFDAASPPAYSFGAGAGLAIDETGALFVASPRDGTLYAVGSDGAQSHGRFEPFSGSAARPVQASVTPSGWSVLDPSAERVITADGVVDLGGAHGTPALEVTLSPNGFGGAPAPQSPAGEHHTLLATDTGVLDVFGQQVRVRESAQTAATARPLRIADCIYAVWGPEARALGCADDGATVATVADGDGPGWTPASDLRPELRTDGHTVIANDPATGQTWTISPKGPRPLTWSGGSGEDLALTAPTNKVAVTEELQPTPGTDPSAPRRPQVQTPPPAEPDPPPSPRPGVPTAPVNENRSTLTAGRVDTMVDRGAGTIAVSWQPFTAEGAEVRGYLVQRLAPGEAAGECVVGDGSPSISGGEVQSAPGTSALFGGAAPPEGGYRFVVWGHTDTECAAAAPVAVLPDPVPGAVADPRGEMIWAGTLYDHRIAPGDAARYEVQRRDAAGRPAGPIAVFTGSAIPRELTAGSFGEPVRFALRACTVWGADAACGPWTEHAASEPSFDFTLTDLAYSEERSEWTWSALPDNGEARVRVVGVGGSSVHWLGGAGFAIAPEPVAREDARLIVRVGDQSLEFSAERY